MRIGKDEWLSQNRTTGAGFKLKEYLVSKKYPHLEAELLLKSKLYIYNLYLHAYLIAQPMRDYINAPITITRGLATMQLNDLVGGSPHSRHLEGLAADLTTEDRSKLRTLFEFAQTRLINVIGELILYEDDNNNPIMLHAALPKHNALNKKVKIVKYRGT